MNANITRQIRAQCPCAGIDYCPLEPLLHLSERMLIQHKCVEAFKWIRSQPAGTDIGWSKAYELWVEEGVAKRFAELYHDGISAEKIWALLKI